MEAGAFVFDDRRVSVLAGTPDVGEDVLEAMYQLSTALRESGPPRGPNAVDAPISTRTLFAWLVSGVMLVLLALWLLGVIR